MKDLLQHIKIKDFTTEAGALISEMNLSYHVFGKKLGTAPVALINHALTGHSNVAGKEGWWQEIVGDKKAINTEVYTILSFNIPGNGFDGFLIDNYKDFIARDVARIFLEGLSVLNIDKLFALIGGSLGGELEILQKIRRGNVQGGGLTSAALASVIPEQCSSDTSTGLYDASQSKIYNALYITTNDGRRALTCMGSRGGAQPLVENIENMQFLYGVSIGDDLVYRNAEDVTNNAEWGSVVSVQVGILVRSDKEVLEEAESRVFLLLDEKITISANRRIYKAYTTTIVLPNRLNRGLGT